RGARGRPSRGAGGQQGLRHRRDLVRPPVRLAAGEPGQEGGGSGGGSRGVVTSAGQASRGRSWCPPWASRPQQCSSGWLSSISFVKQKGKMKAMKHWRLEPLA